jgi:serine/threonine protein kinase
VADLPFDHLGDYDVLAPISEGGMASVWLGRRTARPSELVALKVIRPEHGRNKEFVAMLVDEAGIASRLSHPNILGVRGLDHDGTQYFLVMELLRGQTLRAVWRKARTQEKRLPAPAAAWIGARVADALHYAHELADDEGKPLHVVHRDVNPANVFLTRDGVPKLIDFGLAKARDRIASTAIGIVKGTLAYLAPEQAHGKPADRRSDVFALGVTLWEVSLDRRLFHEDSDVQTVRKVREADIPDPRSLDESYPPELAAVLMKALAKDPEKRWQTGAELRDALDAYVKSAGSCDEAAIRTLVAETFEGEPPLPWERIADEATADQETTRVWDERKEGGAGSQPPPPIPPAPHSGTLKTAPFVAIPRNAAPVPPAPPAWTSESQRLLLTAAACAALGTVVGGLVFHGFGGGGAGGGPLDRRVARLEDLLGVADAGPSAAVSGAAMLEGGAIPSADDHGPQCALAKVASYRVWQEAVAKAKTNAAPAEAACADLWNDAKKQACYRSAMAEIRATQAARDTVIAGGGPAREAVRAVKDDAKNEAIARARAASLAAFTACDDDDGG